MKHAWMAVAAISCAMLAGCTSAATQETTAMETPASTVEETEPILVSEAKVLESAKPMYAVSSQTIYTQGEKDKTISYELGDAGEVLARTTYNTFGADPDEGRSVLFTYDESGVMTSAKGLGYDIDQTVAEKNEAGLPTRVTRTDNALGRSWEYEIEYYDDGSLMRYTIVDSAGEQSVYLWNEGGWFAAANVGGYESPYAFSVADDGSTVMGVGIPHNGMEITYTYDDQGRICRKTHYLSETVHSFDENDNVVQSTQDGMLLETFEYDRVQPSAWLAVTSSLATPGDLLNTTLTPEVYMSGYRDFSMF